MVVLWEMLGRGRRLFWSRRPLTELMRRVLLVPMLEISTISISNQLESTSSTVVFSLMAAKVLKNSRNNASSESFLTEVFPYDGAARGICDKDPARANLAAP